MNFRKRASKRNQNSSRNSNHQYQQLEERKLLAVDVGASITSVPFEGNQPITANIHGDIGPNHIVQFTNDQYTVRSVAGNEIVSFNLEFFFGQVAGADIVVGQDGFGNDVIGDVQDARVVFDTDSQRWFTSAVVASEDGTALPGNDILLAISRTANPIDGFQSVQFVGDTVAGNRFSNFATLAVNGDGVIISANSELDPLNISTSIYTLPKSDLLGMTPSALNLDRFENLDAGLFGSTIQFASNRNDDSDVTLGVGTFNNSTELSIIELDNLADPNTPVTLTQTTTTVPFYRDAPDARQPNDVARLNNISPVITGNAVSQNGFVYTAHAVRGEDANSVIRWYQIDESNGSVVNTGDIADPDLDFIYPSIAVNELGGIAIGFTGSGVGDDQSASSYLTLGFSANGLDAIPTIEFPQDPAVIAQGVNNLVNVQDGINAFGEYSATVVDPDEPFSFYTFQQFVAGADTWGITINEAGISEITPVINGNAVANNLVVRRSAVDNDLVEFVFDGTVTDIYEMQALSSFVLNLGDGDDIVTIDNSLGGILASGGFTVNGEGGTDVLRIVDTVGHQFDITGDGSGTLNTISQFTGFETLVGTEGNDVFTANNTTTDWTIFGDMGDDIFDIQNSATGMFDLDGQQGDDNYGVPLANFGSITITDTGVSENDSLVGLGTVGDDVLTIVNGAIGFNGNNVLGFGFDGVENLDFDGIEGDDVFNIFAINADANFFGSEGSDIFNILTNPPAGDGSVTELNGQLNIDGGDGPNRLVVGNLLRPMVDMSINIDQTFEIDANQITGYSANPISYTGDFGTSIDGGAGIVLIGSDTAADHFNVAQISATNSVLIRSGAGDDVINIRDSNQGDISADGGEGADTYRTTFAGADHTVAIIDSGADAVRDRFSIRSTDSNEEFSIRDNVINVGVELFTWTGVENLIVDTLLGDDIVSVFNNDTDAIRVVLSGGADMGTVNGTNGIRSLRFDGGTGDDIFAFNRSSASSFVQAFGEDGEDEIGISPNSFARSRVDGGAGDDDVTIVYASRDNRRVNARDSGDDSFDTLTILGTATADRLEVRPQSATREGERITYDENTEDLTINLLGSNDIINLFGTSATTLNSNTGVGNDTVNVFSTSSPKDFVTYEFSLAAGTDTGNIQRISAGSRVELFGQIGDDNFNVGSTLSENDGNLSSIRGELFIGGGGDTDGFDTLQVNDNGAGQLAFNDYTITDRSITSTTDRPFESFNFNGMEFIFLSGTDGRNQFTVEPSLEAIIRVDGNDNIGDDVLTVVAPAVVDVIDEFQGNNGSGFFTFTNAFRNVSFQEIENARVFGADGFAVGLDGNMDEIIADLLDDVSIDL